MDGFREITTLQYLGSKSRILADICTPIVENNEVETVIDLFAGSGTIGYALQEYKTVISNDLEFYSYVINQAILNGCSFSQTQENDFFNIIERNYSLITKQLGTLISYEQTLLEEPEKHNEYRTFCESTPSVFSRKTDDELFKSLGNLVDQVSPGAKEQTVPFGCLFLTYFSNAYFGINQCCQIDAIRSAIEDISDTQTKNVLLTALMTVLSVVASTTTHFAQFLKVKNLSTAKNLVEKRKNDIVLGLKNIIKEYRNIGLLEQQVKQSTLCMNLDYMDCLSSLQLSPRTLVYADPPYFKEHYSRYYHVLNTLCKYDYPELSINPQTHEVSIGRYRNDRSSSDFGRKAKALEAFNRLIKTCAKSKSWLMISYSDNSIVDIHNLIGCASEYYDVSVQKLELNHSKQGRASTSKVDEYIITCHPHHESTLEFRSKLEKIKAVKPIVDNPAGFMHNYMARKPYNVTAEIIRQFCPDGGLVYDPMFGSGTSLIEASKQQKKVMGSDINRIAYNICKVSLSSWDLDKAFQQIVSFGRDVHNLCDGLYLWIEDDEKRIIERCHFDRIDSMLIPTEYWYKTIHNGKLSGRKKAEASEKFISAYKELGTYTIRNLKNMELIPNSRIAISNQATVFSYFCNRNLIAMDHIIGLINKKYNAVYGHEILELLVSSAINLIKLSDKKASSQMPYWLPKKNATSRNATFVIDQKIKAFIEGLTYLQNQCKTKLNETSEDAILLNVPSQSIPNDVLRNDSVDLVLTDPPYTDQVPYMEYSQLWYDVFGWHDELLNTINAELVVSDAPSREKDLEDFNSILESIVRRTAVALKENAYFIMFYHTFNLKSWSRILDMMNKYDLQYCGQMPSAMPRKSFKTVMSPLVTLDGNYIVFFQKKKGIAHPSFVGTVEDAEKLALSCAQRILDQHKDVTSQGLYDYGMLSEAFEYGYLSLLADKYKSFNDLLAQRFVNENGYWRNN